MPRSDLDTRRDDAGTLIAQLARELAAQSDTEDRSELNEQIADRLVLAKWTTKEGEPGEGYYLFCSLLNRAVKGPICTPERAKILLPVLLAVNDEMDQAIREERIDREQQAREKLEASMRPAARNRKRKSKRRGAEKSGAR